MVLDTALRCGWPWEGRWVGDVLPQTPLSLETGLFLLILAARQLFDKV